MKPSTRAELDVITHTIATRVARDVESAGYLVRDPEHEYLDLAPDEDDAVLQMVGASIDPSDRYCRLAFGPDAARKALMPKTVPVLEQTIEPNRLASRQGRRHRSRFNWSFAHPLAARMAHAGFGDRFWLAFVRPLPGRLCSRAVVPHRVS